MKLQEWNKIIADKKLVITITLNQCNAATRAEISISSSYEDNLEAGELIKFFARVYPVCNITNNGNILFGSSVTTPNQWCYMG